MNIDSAIFNRLSGISGNVYPQISPDNIFPCMVYDVNEDEDTSLTAWKLKKYTLTIDIETTSKTEGDSLHDCRSGGSNRRKCR